MSTTQDFRRYAEDCLRQADDHDEGLDKTIMLNLALAWVRLAQLASSAEEGSALVPVPVPAQAEVNIVA